MANPRKQPGDAVLSKDSTVKVNGISVGFWWVDGNDLYHFDFARPENTESAWGEVTDVFRSSFKAEIPRRLASIGKLPTHLG